MMKRTYGRKSKAKKELYARRREFQLERRGRSRLVDGWGGGSIGLTDRLGGGNQGDGGWGKSRWKRELGSGWRGSFRRACDFWWRET